MGLVKEGDRHAVLTDIAGVEDHFGDMDFKVAGTEKGVTAIQVDLKIDSISLDICRETLAKAKAARLKVLAKMKEALPAPRPEISPYAPRIFFLYINPEKVGEVIGPAGKVIKRIVAATKAKIDIEETGKIVIASTDVEAAEKAKQMINDITAEAEVGKIYTGQGRPDRGIRRLRRDHAQPGRPHARLRDRATTGSSSVGDVLQLGQTVEVKVLSVEDNRIRLSMKALRAPPEGGSSDEAGRPEGGSGDRGSYGGGRRPRRRRTAAATAAGGATVTDTTSVKEARGHAQRPRAGEPGFTLAEMMVTAAILAVLAGAAMPLAKIAVKREKEIELRREPARRSARPSTPTRSWPTRRRSRSRTDTDGYPPTLDVLVKGVKVKDDGSARAGVRGKGEDRIVKFLRRIPNDPMTGTARLGPAVLRRTPPIRDDLGRGERLRRLHQEPGHGPRRDEVQGLVSDMERRRGSGASP